MSAALDFSTMSPTPEGIGTAGANLEWPDYVVIALYFIGIISVGLWSSRRVKGDSVSGYFMGNRTMPWILVGFSLFASNIGSGHFIGLAGSGASFGFAVSGFEFHCMYALIMLGWLFVPTYTASGVNTMPEFLRKRFGGQRIRIYLSILSIILYIFTKISADLYAGAIFIRQSLNLNIYISVAILLGLAALFTICGGLTAVMWTDLVQVSLMLIGAFVLTILSLKEVGGYQYLMDNFVEKAEPTNKDYIAYKDHCNISEPNNTCVSCSAVTKYYKNLLHPADDPELPWPGVIFGLIVNELWYWCSDQVIVQRTLSAKSVTHAKAGCIVASIIKITPLYLLVLPGMAARILWPNEIGCSNPEKCKQICGSEAGCTNIAYPLLVLRIMPAGATGLMLSVMIAALMSSLTAIFNSASTILTIDIYKRFRKNAGEVEQVIAGRVFVLALVGISIIWIPFIEASQESQLFHYIQSVTSIFGPPVGAVYTLAVFWKRTNEKGAFWSLMIGFVVGVIRFAMDFSYQIPTCASGDPDPRPLLLSKIHYLHFSIILFTISLISCIVISLLTEPIDEIHLYRLTYWTKFSEKVRVDLDLDENVIQNNGLSPDITINNNSKSFDINQNHKKWLYTICCISSKRKANINNSFETIAEEPKLSKEEEAIKCANNAKETPYWELMGNIGAMIIVAIASFLFGIYG